MISRIFALSLLLVSSAALARVQLRTQAELKDSVQFGNRNADITFELNKCEPLEIYNHENIKVIAELLAEDDANATACFSIFAKDETGEFIKVSAPVVNPNYTEPAVVTLASTDGGIFTVNVTAQRV